ncbi:MULTISPECIES: NDP-hexose 2,3-dehydratase family protein [Streptomyces]|uniref:NDP-hexose 2,3-dehydratase family protein n=2 Tax=Streptomyces TaxID=1883 RepID=UPI0029B060C4|nr:NDP-hexose 2,3-dehydratase family protein [Streptomyces scabiei]MDX3117949.1 NDP-hexose 2,3-dehydratase family protein [Streptomyces scabiei]
MTAATVAVSGRGHDALAERLSRSASAADGVLMPTGRFGPWLARRRAAHAFRVDRVPLTALDGWSFAPGTQNLVHHTGRFFSVEGMEVTVSSDGGLPPDVPPAWQQPVIRQPEVGILGILVKEFDGVLHCLMQAKMEPGNPNLLQLSPTVQATRSNYTKVHRGADVPYLEHFVRPDRRRVIADVLQSEHGSWFFRKSNRNMIVEAVGDVPQHDDFCWLTLGQLGELLRRDDVVNMDSRTVLACLPLPDPYGRARFTDTELLSWITDERARHSVNARLTPLGALDGWRRHDGCVERADGRYFRVVGVSVTAGNREVKSWTQPLIEPVARGVTAFLTRDFDGVPHVLARARIEGGFLDTVELGPTVQCTVDNHARPPSGHRPPFLDRVLDADPARIRYAAVHSEEGGRFLGAESRYLVIEADEEQAPAEAPPGFAWVTPGQLRSLVRHGHYVNVQARTLLACLNTVKGVLP